MHTPMSVDQIITLFDVIVALWLPIADIHIWFVPMEMVKLSIRVAHTPTSVDQIISLFDVCGCTHVHPCTSKPV